MPEPLHPALVHLPLGLALVVPLLAVGLAIALWREWLPRRAWVAVIALQAILFGSALAAMRSGEGEEEQVESIVAESAIERHEEAGKIFTIAAGIALAATAAGLAWRNSKVRTWTTFGAAALTIVVAVLAVRVGGAGGELVYRHGAAGAYTTSRGDPPVVAREMEHEQDEDD